VGVGMTGRSSLKVAALVSIAAAAFIGCSRPPEVDGENVEALNTLFPNDKAAYDFFVGKGLKNFQSAGIVGNLDQESGVDPTAVQYGGGPGRGIAQWSVGGRWDTDGNDNVTWYANTKGADRWSLGLQLDFIWYELTTFGYGFSELKATTNITDATVVFMAKYEICGTCAQSQRITYAQNVLNAYGAAVPLKASFVSQTWPYASQPPFTLKCGESIAANIVLRNDGTRGWDSSTKLGTTQPRDRNSMFAATDWLAPSRAAHPKEGTVAPGANGTFQFTFHGPTGTACVPGQYHEFFGMVQESMAWFSDSGQGGPPDNQIEAFIDLVPGDQTQGDMGGGGAGGGGGGGSGGGGGGTSDGGTPNDLGKPPWTPPPGGGCSVVVGRQTGASLGSLILILLIVAYARRRSRSLSAD
jgi:uncharacterized membrane protein YgcG